MARSSRDDLEDHSQPRPGVFISYRWNETKDQVREIADHLKSLSKYDVWIDTEEMFGDKNERMEEGIRSASVVVIFFSDEYQKSRDCRKEAESADRNNKPMVFVKMQLPKCELQTWFAPIIGSSIFVDYFKFKSPAEEIVKHIERVLSPQHPQSHLANGHNQLNATPDRLKRFVTIKVPKFTKYQNRSDEPKICDALLDLCTVSAADREGVLVICGGGGTGKTTLVSQLIHMQSNFLNSSCKINAVVWLNCFKWTGDAFDEADFVRALIDLVEKASEYSGFRSLEDVAEYFEREKERLLIILDDVFNIRVLETVCDHCPNVSCMAVTRDVDEMSKRQGLVRQVYRLQELDDNEIVEMFENAYRLKGKLAREQFTNLAKFCSGLPIVVSLIAARFQDCESSRDFLAEYELILDEVKVKELRISGPYGTVSKLFEFSIEQLDEALRKMYYSFLLFDPAEPVDVEDLAILWNCANPHRALVRCRQIAKKSLARPVVSSNSSEKTAPMTSSQKPGDFFLVHQILHEAAVDNAIKTHKIASSLANLRAEIMFGFTEDPAIRDEIALEVLSKSVTNQRRHVLETIFAHVDIVTLARIVGKKSDKLTSAQSFAHFLYNAEWPDNGPPTPTGNNYSIRLLRQLFIRIVRHNQAAKLGKDRIDMLSILTEPDSSGNCLLLQMFGDGDSKAAYRNERRKLIDFLSPVDECFKRYNMLEWFIEGLRDATPLFEAAGRGNLQTVQELVASSPELIRVQNAFSNTPLIAASIMGHKEVVKFLYQADPSDEHINATNKKGKDAFLVAANLGQLEIVQFLYDNSKDPSALLAKHDYKGRSAATLAAMNGATDVLSYLLEKQPSLLNEPDRAGRTPFIQAARFGHMETTKFLLPKCVHNSEKDKNGATPMMYAAMYGHCEIVSLLLEKGGASLKQESNHGGTAFTSAACHGHIEVVQFLYAKDPQSALEAQQRDKKTALVLAAERDEEVVVKFLLEKCRTRMLNYEGDSQKVWHNLISAVRFAHRSPGLVQALIGDADSYRVDPAFAKVGQKYIDEAKTLAEKLSNNKLVSFLKTAKDPKTRPEK